MVQVVGEQTSSGDAQYDQNNFDDDTKQASSSQNN